MRFPHASFTALCAVLMAGGCAAPGPSHSRHAFMHLASTHRAAVFSAAELALVELEYRIDRRDVGQGLLIGITMSELGGGQITDRRARLSSGANVRRMAEVRIEQDGDAVSVYCKVIVQEQTTQAHRLFAHDRTEYDTPNSTPIEREAGTTTRQNTVWRTIRRDRASERKILAAITARDTLAD
jgi:hypothetical protein